MRNLIKLLSGAVFGLFLITSASAQQGQLQAGQFFGNPSGSQAFPVPTTLSPMLDIDLCTTQGSVATRQASSWVCLTPGTSGLPLLSQGGSANLHYATLANAALANSSITLGSTSISLGATVTTIAGLTLNNLNMTGTATVTSGGSSAFSVGPNGATSPAFNVDASTASLVAGLNVKGAATGGVVAISTTGSGSLSINATGTGTIAIGNVSTGAVTITPALTLSGALTYGGTTLANGITGAGNMVLQNGPTLSSLSVATSFTATGLVTFADMATAAVATSAQTISGASSVLVPASAIYNTETTTTFGATTTFDFSTFINTAVTLTGNTTTQTLSNVKAGQAGQIRFIQDGTGSRTTVWNSIFKFTGGVTPALTTTAGAIDVLFYSCTSSSACYASLNANMK